MAMANVVQFMHPGCEVVPAGLAPYNGWNGTGRHCRRLLRHCGEFVDSQNRIVQGDLVFWNEYEAPTNFVPIAGGNQGSRFAKNVHTIITPIPPLTVDVTCDRKCCINTDPCVFGKTFKYSNCQQTPNGDLWSLPVGSVILFGARLDYLFALDTVFVIGEIGQEYLVPVAKHQLPFAVSREYRLITLDNLIAYTDKRTGRLRDRYMFYRGAKPLLKNGEVTPDSIYSYTPTRVYGSLNYNERCVLDLNGLNAFMQNNGISNRTMFNPKLTQWHSTIILNGGCNDVRLVWKEVRRIVQQVNGFELGVHFPWLKK